MLVTICLICLAVSANACYLIKLNIGQRVEPNKQCYKNEERKVKNEEFFTLHSSLKKGGFL